MKGEGDQAMQRVSTFIRDGSRGFFSTQYTAIGIFAVLTGLGLFGLFSMREPVSERPSPDTDVHHQTQTHNTHTAAPAFNGASALDFS